MLRELGAQVAPTKWESQRVPVRFCGQALERFQGATPSSLLWVEARGIRARSIGPLPVGVR